MSLNQISLIGFIGKDAETKALPNTGRMVTTFSIATQESWKDDQGEWRNRTQWHNVIAYGDTFHKLSTRLTKGAHLFVQGSLLTRQYEGSTDVTHKSKKIQVKIQRLAVEVRADTIRLLDRQTKDDAGDAREEAPE